MPLTPPLAPFARPSTFSFPENLVESAWFQHAPFACWLVDVQRPRVLVELGTHHGFSYLVFCQAVTHLGCDTRAYAVDHWHGDVNAGFYGDDVLTRLRAYHDARYGHFSALIESSFKDAAARFVDGEIDLLHIDGAHGPDDVKADFETWRPKMSSRGIMLLHDIAERQPGFGVWELWDRIAPQYPHFAFDHGHGLGVLGVGADSAAVLHDLFDLTGRPESDDVRRAFVRLGEGVSDRARLSHLQAALSDRDHGVTAARELANEAIARATSAEQRVIESNAQAALTAQRAATLEVQATLARQEAAQADARIRRLDADLAALQDQIASLSRTIAAVHASTSWRVTAPLRALGQGARHLLRRGRGSARGG